ncbi:hypothetical protein FJT64_019900 [Amphibalanus amphitrite]|uniref:Uncharacterized protein n=1 Tax=Amphibalanus amphitrite TaxID=1232801 RepID=A0A6A4X3P2_AMPAM|nr:hypothetical protein FJT64_019900 [Amphibalanus amphitrite]
MAGLDVKLIPEFDGSGEDHVVDWIEKVEMVCTLQTPAVPQECVIPLRLRGGALSVYRQLSSEDKKDAEKVKSALKRAFALDKFSAYERFAERRLRPGESVDDILVNEAVLPARDVAEHLRNFGLESKEPADTLTRVPEKWMKGRTANGDAAAVADSGGAAVSDTAAAGGTASSDSDGDAVNAALGTAGPAPARGDGDGETTTSGNGRQEDDDALLNETTVADAPMLH